MPRNDWGNYVPPNVLDKRRNLIAQRCTLDGMPAKISGAHNDFATVRTIKQDGYSGEWCWETVERIIENGGAFKL